MDTGEAGGGCFGESSRLLLRGRRIEALEGVCGCLDPPVVSLGRGWSCGVLAKTPSCPSASFQAVPGSTQT